MQGKVTEKKWSKEEVNKKIPVANVPLSEFHYRNFIFRIPLKDTLVATLYYNFLGPGGIPIHQIFSTN